MFPKIMVPPNHPILIGFSIIFTIHFGIPLFLGNSHISPLAVSSDGVKRYQEERICWDPSLVVATWSTAAAVSAKKSYHGATTDLDH